MESNVKTGTTTGTSFSSTPIPSLTSLSSSSSFIHISDMEMEENFNSGDTSSTVPFFLHASSVHIRSKKGRSRGTGTRYFLHDRTGQRYHYLDTCFLCKQNIAKNRHIFMYRGDVPFCSKECRQEQMEMDLALERIHRKRNQILSHPPANLKNCSNDKNSTKISQDLMNSIRRSPTFNLRAGTALVAS